MKKVFLWKRAKSSEIAGKRPFLVCGLSYFSFDSGCFCLTSLLIISVFFCFSSVFLLSFFCLSCVFLDSDFFCLDSFCLTSVLHRADGHQLNKKNSYPKMAPKNGLGSAVPVSQPKILCQTYPAGSAEPFKCANLPGEFAHIHVGKKCTFLAHECCKTRPAPHNSRKNLYQNMLEHQGSQKINPCKRTRRLYIYICCEVIIWSKFGGFWKLLSGPSWVFGSYYLSKFVFLAYKNSGFKRFVLHTQLSFCVFFLSPIIRQFSKNSLFQKKGAKIGFFKFQCFKYKF